MALKIRNIHIKGTSPTKRPLVRLPWPRMADDGITPLGIDIKEKRKDIIKLTYKYCKVPGVSMEELLQEIFMTILHKNHGNSAHDPRKSSFGHYVCLISRHISINLVNKRKRLDREKESIDAGMCGEEDNRSFLETYELPDEDPSLAFNEKMESIETQMRLDGKWELARYVRAVRSGSKPDVIRQALTWGDRKITTKYVRDLRNQIDQYVNF